METENPRQIDLKVTCFSSESSILFPSIEQCEDTVSWLVGLCGG